ncbi:MAG: xanthine dehydrogenase family protein molybdopterin-binding subunit [Planctomycetota bacterium]
MTPAQDAAGQAPRKKKKVKTVQVVDGHEREVEIEVDDTGLAWPERSTLRLLNHDLQRIDGPAKVTGRARFTHDMRPPGVVFARLLCCPLPVAKVTLDLEAARRVPGVLAVIAIKDGLTDDTTRYLGQPVAAVAGITPDHAEDGLRALLAAPTDKPRFEPKPWAVTVEQSVAPNAPGVRRNGNTSKTTDSGGLDQADLGNKGATVGVDATYEIPVQHHVCLETHGVVVDYRGGDEATIYASTQATFSIAGEAAEILGLEANRVRAVVEHMGGGFGSKFGLGAEGKAACLLAKELKRPVHLMLSRSDEFLMAGNRSGGRVRLMGGIEPDGTLGGLIARVYRFGGLGAGSHAAQPYIYSFKGHASSANSVFTNTDASRAMRAPGHPQASFAIESYIDELAYAAGLDPLEVRKKNLRDPAYARQLDQVARAIGWAEHPHRTKPGSSNSGESVGIGFAISTWGGGGNAECEVDVRIERDGSVTASVGTQDLGTGTRTYVAAIVAEEFGLELGQVLARIGDSRLGRANGSGGSTTTASLAPAVKHAAFTAREKLAAHLAPILRTKPELVVFEPGRIYDASQPARALTWTNACATLGSEGLSARGTWQSDLAGNGVHGAQAARVSVDPSTGRVRVLKMVACQDCGLPMNRLAVRSQLNGGMVQALSYGLFEERVIDPVLGVALSANLEDYKIAGALEIPEMISIIDDGDTRQAVIGMSEPAIVPGHSAIANAVFNACGARVRNLPLTPDKILTALKRV